MGLTALVSYLVVGLLIPILNAAPTFKVAMRERTAQAGLHSLLLETLQGYTELAGLGALGNTRRRVGRAPTRCWGCPRANRGEDRGQ